MLPGVYSAKKKDGTIYYRSSITYKSKHISLGSFDSEYSANQAYIIATEIIKGSDSIENSFYRTYALSFEKIVSLINFRDNNMYIPTPIYLRKNYFSYYLDINHELKFDIEDLFYYSSHKIMKRQGHLFVNDYGMQVTILGRFGIKPHAVCGKDYIFENGDSTDMRYSNIKIINPYHGVSLIHTKSGNLFRVKLHINGNYTIGEYKTVNEAAVAYNKAADLAKDHGIERSFFENYIEDLSPKEYARIYTELDISPKFLQYLKRQEENR